MIKKGVFTYGFKAKAEKLAIEYRDKLNIHPCAPLCAFKLASYLAIPIYSATEFITDHKEVKTLSANNGTSCPWDALTMITAAGNRIIIHNHFNSEVRQQSNIMHELAHVICNHTRETFQYDFQIPFGMRHFDEKQEEEAKYLGSALQIAKPGLLWSIKNNWTNQEISNHFNASLEMTTYRLNLSGLSKRRNFTQI